MGRKKDLKKCEKLLTELLCEIRTVKMYLKDIDEKLKSDTSLEESTENNDILRKYTDEAVLKMLEEDAHVVIALDKAKAIRKKIIEKFQMDAKDDSGQLPRTFGEWMERVKTTKKRDNNTQTESLNMEDIQLMCPKEYW